MHYLTVCEIILMGDYLQLIYFAHAAETLSNTQAELEELSLVADEQSR
jgi:hypothetical protein